MSSSAVVMSSAAATPDAVVTPVELFDAAPDAIVGVDRAGRIVLANAHTSRMFGYSRAELVGQPIEVLVPELDRGWLKEHRPPLAGAAGESPSPSTEPQAWPTGVGQQLTARRRDGSQFRADVSLSWPLAEGDPQVVAVRDVTRRPAVEAEQERLGARAERERMETRLQQAQRLESLGQLAGGVAHDFNNLLAVIVNYAAFVSEQIEQAAIAEPDRWHVVARDMHQIQRATDRGMALTHQLLAFGRREVVRPQVLSLNAVIRDVQPLLVGSIGEQVHLVISLAPGLWAVQADPGQLEQVLVNLAVNARDAMPGGGALTIDTANVTIAPAPAPASASASAQAQAQGTGVGAEAGAATGTNVAAEAGAATGMGTEAAGSAVPGRRYVRVRVCDTGAGMSSDVVERAFEPFFTTKPKGEGTGLGLATVYGIITQAGGEIHIYSELGIGTTFHLLLPATEEALEEPEESVPTAQRTHGGGETILVVEDEPAIREVARRILERHGYQVILAGTGPEALDLAAQHSGAVQLLMTDVVMPGMLGKEVAERLYAERPQLRVLYVSGYARPVLASTGTLDAGVTLLEKPFSENALLEAVRRVLDAAG